MFLIDVFVKAPADDQDAESTPTKQDYLNTLRESILQTTCDAKAILDRPD